MSTSLLRPLLSTFHSQNVSTFGTAQAEPQSKKFAARSLLPAAPTGWQIQTGFVRTLSYLEDGTTVPLGVWGTGDIVGVSRSNQHIECLTTVEVLPAAIADAKQLNDILAAHLQQTEELMIIRSIRRIEPALIKLLGWLANRFGRTIDRGQLLELRLTHQDIAELLGATRVTITRCLQQLEAQGLIERSSVRQILLHEWETWHYEI
ncbi:Crp/Fnr family transcriptional regulator [Microcoleus sp. FACHB-1515]|uniref:Crp/Fnr family transcriptional regulator n=1 Tax=Cyanophyceae TaxID=3028117 RepID=UPI001686947D|nr:Crp/Fnr family transcriptional regulator [Microcoleus sp. FACHB-1515]MBD2092961.1 Crp/Fnr family transcriptional regulator [Microcoleus sp. FACHB-1515]